VINCCKLKQFPKVGAAKKAASAPPPVTSAGASMFEEIAAACASVREQAPLNLGMRCQNLAIALAFLLRHRGIEARITGGAAWWRVGDGPDIEEYDPDIDPASFHCWVKVATPDGPIFADASTYTVAGQPRHLIWRPHETHERCGYAESPLVLPQVEQARERLLCALQSSPPPSS
jgi:Transglutaminase-like superfamily